MEGEEARSEVEGGFCRFLHIRFSGFDETARERRRDRFTVFRVMFVQTEEYSAEKLPVMFSWRKEI